VGAKRFCIKPVLPYDETMGVRPTTCGVGKHTSKFEPEPNQCYLRGNDATVYCQPAYWQNSVPPEVLIELKTMKKTNQEWKELFGKYQDPDQAQTLSDLGVSKLELKTPKKARFGVIAELQPVYIPELLKEISIQADILSSHYHWWTTSDDESLLPGSLIQFLREIRIFLMDYERWLVEAQEITSNRLSLVEDDIHQIRNFCEGISGNLGRPISFQDMDFPDVWCTIEYIGSLVSSSNSVSETQHLQASGTRLEKELPRLLPVLKGWWDHVKSLADIKQSVNALETTVATHTSRLSFIQPMLLQIGKLAADFTTLSIKVNVWAPLQDRC
jgi:hypothetical protein